MLGKRSNFRPHPLISTPYCDLDQAIMRDCNANVTKTRICPEVHLPP
jgi:hypothetical protein